MVTRALQCGRAALLQLNCVLSFLVSFGALFAVSVSAADVSPAARVLVVVNDNSPVSRTIGEYYARRRGVAAQNICHLRAPADEEIGRSDYDRLAVAVGACLRSRNLVESVYYIVTTLGDPLKIRGNSGLNGDAASVDSELTLLYSELKGAAPHRTGGIVPNPFYGKGAADFSHPEFPM